MPGSDPYDSWDQQDAKLRDKIAELENALKLKEALEKKATDYKIAIRDHNVQSILRTFFSELWILFEDYDMNDTLFGDRVNELIRSYERDMK